MTQSNSNATKTRENGNPTIVTEAKTLARAADTIVEMAGGALAKNSVLNAMASAICGAKRNWGFVKGEVDTIHDPRVPEATSAPAPQQGRPTHVRDLRDDDLFKVPLPKGQTGYLPKARIAPRTDGGIDITCVTWGSAYQPKQDDLLVDTVFTLPLEACRNIDQNWPTPASLKRDIAWGYDSMGHFGTLSEVEGQLAILVGSWSIIDAEKLFNLAKHQSAQHAT